jgi:hypothetical protein
VDAAAGIARDLIVTQRYDEEVAAWAAAVGHDA